MESLTPAMHPHAPFVPPEPLPDDWSEYCTCEYCSTAKLVRLSEHGGDIMREMLYGGQLRRLKQEVERQRRLRGELKPPEKACVTNAAQKDRTDTIVRLMRESRQLVEGTEILAQLRSELERVQGVLQEGAGLQQNAKVTTVNRSGNRRRERVMPLVDTVHELEERIRQEEARMERLVANLVIRDYLLSKSACNMVWFTREQVLQAGLRC